jgi:hypothetical protein
MSDSKNGGPAFPDGMTLRDWFAGMAMQSIQKDISFFEYKQCEVAVEKGETTWTEIRNNTDAAILTEEDETIAYAAFFIADAMLKARKDTL